MTEKITVYNKIKQNPAKLQKYNEYMKVYMREYSKTHKPDLERKHKQQGERITCQYCGATSRRDHIHRHQKTKKCMKSRSQ